MWAPSLRVPLSLLAMLGATALPALLATSDAAAEGHAAPWVEPGLELAPALRSARVLLADQPLLGGPSREAPRRGSAARDAHLPIFAARRGPGCNGAWIQVGPFAWLCEDAADLSSAAPIDAGRRMLPESLDGMPYRYFFVGSGGSAAYKQLESVDVTTPDMALEPGFAVAIVGERSLEGARYGRTGHGLWVPMRDLGPVHALSFHGEELPALQGGPIPVAWVVVDAAPVLTKPGIGAPASGTMARFSLVHVRAQIETPGGAFLRIGEGEWIRATQVRHPAVSEPPPEVDAAAQERWIDVSLETQTLVAYEGRRPVFATIVSTGKGKPGTPMGTPTGTHRIWIKLLTSDMDNLEDENAAHYYRMEDVPWVQYFAKGVGLHGAFWHRSFGHVRSHGCVNLSPLDAERLFWWTVPHVPAGWTAASPNAYERGTVIRVR